MFVTWIFILFLEPRKKTSSSQPLITYLNFFLHLNPHLGTIFWRKKNFSKIEDLFCLDAGEKSFGSIELLMILIWLFESLEKGEISICSKIETKVLQDELTCSSLMKMMMVNTTMNNRRFVNNSIWKKLSFCSLSCDTIVPIRWKKSDLFIN